MLKRVEGPWVVVEVGVFRSALGDVYETVCSSAAVL